MLFWYDSYITSARPLKLNSLTLELLCLCQPFSKVCVTISAGPAARPNRPPAPRSDREPLGEMEGGRKQIVCAVGPDSRQQHPSIS